MGRWGTLLTVAGLLVLGAVLPAQTGYKMIVNPSNPIDSVSKAQLARFFLENAVWDDGRPAAAVDLPPASPIRELFSRDVLGMPIPAVQSLWRTVSGSGRGDAPCGRGAGLLACPPDLGVITPNRFISNSPARDGLGLGEAR